ncbi:MAG: site-specific DNA-methyltransferase [Candidatus Omnitrophota bacterium]|jgi:DNA modification methylase|nr:MAG: site-specific DNA-methyltransferase [Candidatus Omnitrophota bacterium]
MDRFSKSINQIILGDAAVVLQDFPDHSIDLIVTSPPYWTAVAYEITTEHSSGSYEDYLQALLTVWKQCARVLRPNGKLAINAPIMPIPKKLINRQHTRHLKNICNDIEAAILSETNLERFSLFTWQKQTSKLMFGSYPYPGNLLENNTIEFINVYVKPGKPPKFSPPVKDANILSREEWIDLTQQVWFMYPQDVKRGGDHPAPFPEKLPARLIRLYTYGAADDFPGEIVLDPFCGTGATCAAAAKMRRRFIGIDICEQYVETAQKRVELTSLEEPPLILVGRAKYPGKEELQQLQLGAAGRSAEKKHRRKTYGRKITSAKSSKF